jgi:hypothetical protein
MVVDKEELAEKEEEERRRSRDTESKTRTPHKPHTKMWGKMYNNVKPTGQSQAKREETH